jgi:D-alanyl-D-alanine carboxypeptidase/D-alanyl-D-alanine-endopeptidase (penicillin-binding protein 4)
MARLLILFMFLFLSCLVKPCPASGLDHVLDGETPVKERLNEFQKSLKAVGGSLSIHIESMNGSRIIQSSNAEKPMRPAGTQKLITAAAAMDILKPGFRFTTGLYLRTDEEENPVSLLVRGSGDPTISSQYSIDKHDVWFLFDHWAKILKEKKIKSIPLVLDTSCFDDRLIGTGWPVDQLGHERIPSISALNFNHNCFEILYSSGKKPGSLARYQLAPSLDSFYYFKNMVRLGETSEKKTHYERMRDGNLIIGRGMIPLRTPVVDRAAVNDPAAWFGSAMQHRFRKKRIELTEIKKMGDEINDGQAGGNQVLLDRHDSDPLLKILRVMFHHDLTLEAEVLFKTMGHQNRKPGEPLNLNAGSEAVHGYLDRIHIRQRGIKVLDGSGMSSLNRMNAKFMVGLLRRVLVGPNGPKLGNLFPQSGETGVMENRFAPHNQDTWVRALCSSSLEDGLQHDEVMLGLLGKASGESFLFCFMINNAPNPTGSHRMQMDDIILDLIGH